MRKEKDNKIKIYELIFFVIIVVILVVLVLSSKNNLEKHCEKAVCNKDNTICYNYELNKEGMTVKTWEGNCSKVK